MAIQVPSVPARAWSGDTNRHSARKANRGGSAAKPKNVPPIASALGAPGRKDQIIRAIATTALAAPEELRASPQATRHDRKRIKELERELLRKDRALAETAALLVLSKKVQAIFNKGEDE